MRRILIGMAIGLLASPGLAASFNCAKATQPIERAICAYPQLDRLDSLLGERLRSVLREQDKAERERRLAEQRAWLASREVQCPGYAEECLADLYRSRLQALAVSTPAVPFRAALPQHQLREAAPLCELPDLQLPDETLVYAAGAYSGRELDAQIDQSGHQATRFDILVNSPERPVALLLGAYEPSIWNIGWTEGTRILAVLATGYHRQAVAGLPAETPLRISSYDNKGPCGYLYIDEKSRDQLNPMAQRVFKRNVDLVYRVGNGAMVLGQPLSAGALQFTSADTPPESFIDAEMPKAGPAGLADAVAKGLMRPANEHDFAAWQALLERRASQVGQGLPPLANPPPRSSFQPHNAYVLLKAQRLPAGLYGAHAASFFLPVGVPAPQGALGHSALYDFNSESCRGALCVAH
ncbi:MAG: DUF1311 domain-containing protein [Pseudomonas sp.]|nr:MAG: DUF1311 domain-containing protein [Pseudomonas sp.]